MIAIHKVTTLQPIFNFSYVLEFSIYIYSNKMTSKWNLSYILSTYITKKLELELNDYLQGVKFNIDIGTSTIASVRDIALREDALDQFSLPI